MEITQNTHNGFLVLTVIGKLDSSTSPEFGDYIDTIDDFGKNHVILDMAALDYISSAGLRLILNSSKVLKKENKRLLLCGMQDHIREVFEISGFDTFLEIYDSLEKALKKD